MYIGDYKPEGSILSLPENRDYLSSEAGLHKAMNDGVILEAMALRCDENFRLTVDLFGIKGYIDREEAALTADGEPVRDIAVITRVGKAVCFKVIGFFSENGKTAVMLSRRAAQEECKKDFLSGLEVGDVIDAKVTHLETFGVFVDIGCGIVSLLSIDCISVSRISHPSDRFKVGDRLKVIVKSIEAESGRIFVTHKELLGTWQENADMFAVGQTVAGIVRSIESYGIFVELTPNLAGLAEYRPDMTVGQVTSVYIKNIIPQRMKLKLVIIDSYRGEILPTAQINNFEEQRSHIDRWTYSPPECDKVVETVFE